MDNSNQALPAGFVLEHYRIDSVLGVGGFGITYKARDDMLKQWVAIKEYLPIIFARRDASQVTVQPRENSEDEFRHGLCRFLEEAQALARFHHPNIVRLQRFIEANGTAYLIMEWQEGHTLSDLLAPREDLSEARIREIFIPILRGLSEVHRAGLLHRDIKPDNIYLCEQGEPMLIDFGASRQAAIGPASQKVTRILSPGYAPPEQYTTELRRQDTWTDLYALGGVLYRCISGVRPVDSPNRREAIHEGEADPLIPAVEVGRGRYSEALLRLVDQLLATSASARPSSAEAVLAALESGGVVAAPPPAPGADDETLLMVEGPAPRGQHAAVAGGLPRRRRWIPVLSVIALAGLGAALWWLAPNSDSTSEADSGVAPIAAPALGGIDIRSEPGGASVWLDDVAYGETPVVADDVPVGDYHLRLSLPGYADHNAQVLVEEGEVVRASPSLLARTGELRLDGSPQGAWVELDGERLEVTAPATLEGLALGAHGLAIGRAGYRTHRAEVAIDEGGAWQSYRLEPLPRGTLSVGTEPPDAVVSLPEVDEPYAEGMALAAGRYQLRVEAPGYQTWTGSVELVAGEASGLQVVLEPEVERPPPQAGPKFRDALRRGGLGPEMVVLPRGSFIMGDRNGGGAADELPLRTVTIDAALAIAVREVTFAEYDRFVAASAGRPADDEGWGRGDRPVIHVSWDDARSYADWLSEQTGERYRLPSEAEWEYAARAGSSSRYPWGDDASHRYANYGADKCCGGRSAGQDQWVHTAPTASFPPNSWGLHDMHGNVYEWVEDCYRNSYRGAPVDGSARLASPCEARVLRGGSWDIYPLLLRSADRFWLYPGERNSYAGFRLVKELRGGRSSSR